MGRERLFNSRTEVQNPQRNYLGWTTAMSQQRRPSTAADGNPGLPPESGEHAPHIPDGLPASLTRALRWLADRPDQPVPVAMLAIAAGVRPRTLEAHFRQFLKTTPLGWVRRVRLARARQQLLAAGHDDREDTRWTSPLRTNNAC